MDADDGSGMGMFGVLMTLGFIVLMIASSWKVYVKAGQPGWTSIVPIYNIVVLLKIIGKPWWWIVGFFIPFLNLVLLILMCVGLAKAFGKGVGFAIGIILLSFIFYPILAFSDAKYTAPSAPV